MEINMNLFKSALIVAFSLALSQAGFAAGKDTSLGPRNGTATTSKCGGGSVTLNYSGGQAHIEACTGSGSVCNQASFFLDNSYAKSGGQRSGKIGKNNCYTVHINEGGDDRLRGNTGKVKVALSKGGKTTNDNAFRVYIQLGKKYY